MFFTGASSYNIPATPLTEVREYLQQAETTKNRIEHSAYLSALFNIPTEPKNGSTIFFPYLDFMTWAPVYSSLTLRFYFMYFAQQSSLQKMTAVVVLMKETEEDSL